MNEMNTHYQVIKANQSHDRELRQCIQLSKISLRNYDTSVIGKNWGVGGSDKEFVNIMNNKGRRIGCMFQCIPVREKK